MSSPCTHHFRSSANTDLHGGKRLHAAVWQRHAEADVYDVFSTFHFFIVPSVFASVNGEISHQQTGGDKLSIETKRKARGYTQAQLAELLEVDRSAISKWETGASVPCRKYRVRLCRLLMCTEAELMAPTA